MYTLEPFFRYCSTILQSPSEKITTRCHSVFSLRSPVALSRQVSEVAVPRLEIGRPSWVRRISGSLPRFPTRMTLFTLPAIAALHYLKSLGWILRRRRARRFGDHLGDRPYTVPGPARRTIPGYPHIAFPDEMFQFCSAESVQLTREGMIGLRTLRPNRCPGPSPVFQKPRKTPVNH